jgi:hypothetical protein
LIISKPTILAMTQEYNFVAIHTVKLYINSLTIIFLGVKHNRLDGNSEVKVDDFKGSVEYITLQIAHKVLPNHKINYFLFSVFFKDYSLVFL